MRLTRLAAGALTGVATFAILTGVVAAASNNIIVTYAGNGSAGYSGDGGPAASAKLSFPTGVVLDNAANIFIGDTANNRIRKVMAATSGGSGGTISTYAGTGGGGFSGDGGPATSAKLSGPTALAVKSDHTLYVADTGNDRVRQISPTGVITTVAGNGQIGYAGDGGPAASAKLAFPTGLALDSAGNLFIADTGNNVVREVTTDGKIHTYAGKNYQSGNNSPYGMMPNSDFCKSAGDSGPAINAYLCAPTGLAVSGSNLLISDTGNTRVRKVTGGTITAFAGTGSFGFSGDGGQATKAKLSFPVGVAYDPLGDVYIVDVGNVRVRQVTPSGVISTFAGTGQIGFSGDNGPAELAKIWPAGSVTTDSTNVFFADTANQRVRRVHKNGPPPALPEGQKMLLVSSAVIILSGGVLLTVRRQRRRRILVPSAI